MLTDVQRERLPRAFRMYDIDKNGFIDLDDFELLRQRVMALKQLPLDSPEAQALSERFVKRFQHMQQFADPAEPHRVTVSQWLAYIDHVNSDPQTYEAQISGTGGFIFSLFDLNGDGALSLEEFRQYFQSLGLDEDAASELYSRLGLADDELVSKEQYQVLLDQFFKSEDTTAPGTILFGR